MERFWKEVDKALAEQGKRRPWLADKTGISLGRINNWYVRGTLPRLDTYLTDRGRLRWEHTSASPEPVGQDRDAYKDE